VLLALLSAVLAIALQSSTATIALVIALGAAGQISLPIGVAVVCGANVGIALTTLMLGWKQIASRRLAMANLLGKTVVAVVILLFLTPAANLINLLPGDMGNKVAYTHTAFNILLACLCLPLVDPITRFVEKCIPSPQAPPRTTFGPRHIHSGYFDSTALALGQSLKEILHAGEIVRHMLAELWRALETNDLVLARSIGEMDDKVDLLDSEIKRFLTRIIDMEGDSSDAAEQMRQLRYLAELEAIGDIIDKNLSELVIKKIQSGANFSAQGWDELRDFYKKVAENLLIAETAFTTSDQLLARRLLNHKQKLRDLDRELRDRHFHRLRQGLPESHETSAIHLDLLTYLKRINSHVSHVAYATLTDEQV